MKRYRSFLFPEARFEGDVVFLDDRESHHLTRVLRAKEGEVVELLDGKGVRYTGIIQSLNPREVKVAVTSVESTPVAEPRVVLLQSESKAKSMDLVLRMATEIGVSAIQPVFTEQGTHAQRRREKRLLVMIEACKQCGLSHLPELQEPLSLGDWLRWNVPRGRVLRLVASLDEGSEPLLKVLGATSPEGLDEVVIAVGPAGDFSKAEYALLRENGFKGVRLGANVLRVETAVAYILSVVDQVVRTSNIERRTVDTDSAALH